MFWYFLGITASLIILSGLGSQIWKGFKTKKMDDLSYGMMGFLGIGMFLWLLYGLHIKDAIVTWANVAGVSFNLLMIGMKWNYSKK